MSFPAARKVVEKSGSACFLRRHFTAWICELWVLLNYNGAAEGFTDNRLFLSGGGAFRLILKSLVAPMMFAILNLNSQTCSGWAYEFHPSLFIGRLISLMWLE
jgi:hypothetical protein